MFQFKFLLPLCFVCFSSFCACSPARDFTTDPLCDSCVKSACDDAEKTAAFESHFLTQTPEIKAQLVALIEQNCSDYPSWAASHVSEAYQQFSAAYYALEQPWLKLRAMRAFDDVLNGSERIHLAADYLGAHVDEWNGQAWTAPYADKLFELADNDEVFPLLVKMASKEKLTALAQMELNDARLKALVTRWPELSDEQIQNVLGSWISANWVMQSSGSAALPQYLVLDAHRRPLPQNAPDVFATLNVESIKIQNKEIKKARDSFQTKTFVDAGAYHERVDLTPWLSSTDTYRISANAVLNLWLENPPQACVPKTDDCKIEPFFTQNITFDKQYKVFLGLETGAPNRVKEEAKNAETSKIISFEMCNSAQCLPLWQDGAKTKDRKTPLRVISGEDFYLKTTVSGGKQPVAARLMARSGAGKTWREIATTYGFAPTRWTLPMRAEIELGDLCSTSGKCSLELQIRPSLRMARRDPRFASYWGATLELGNVSLDVQNFKPEK